MRAKDKSDRFGRGAVNLVIFGPPGSGKGTYASRLEQILGIVKISTGDIFRNAVKEGAGLGLIAKEYVERGKLVPDEIVNSLMKERLMRASGRCILDGYPRTLNQAEYLEGLAKVDCVINLLVSEEVIILRLSSRRVCGSCGAIFNVLTLKPKVEGVCDYCGGELYQREDDTPEVIRRRLRVYEEQSKPVIEYYRSKGAPFVEIRCNDPSVPPEVIVEEILRGLKGLGLI